MLSRGNVFSRLFASRISRFVGIGITNALVSYLVFGISMWFLEGYALRAAYAQIFGFGAGAVWSFFWNRNWTFESDGHLVSQGVRFFIIQGILLILSAALMSITVDFLHWPYTPTWIGVMGFITVANYLSLRYLVF